jgi:tetratricopeptide (TPR) repeat protein
MNGPSSNPYSGNRHADVLHLEPTEESAKVRLVEEVKNRAKGAFSQKDMLSAELLYSKAISLLDTMPGKAEAPLYSNRAMVRLNLNKVEGALEDAKSCIGVDPAFVKAYYRKAQALTRLSEWDKAIAAAEHGLSLEPTNKAWSELIEKAKVDQAKDIEDKAKLKRDAQDVRVELHNASTSRASQPAKKEKKEGEEDAGMRGYKTTSDGKTTSFFHTEISSEAKDLIAKAGFGKPQKLDAPIAEKEAKGGGSSWNQAGTYEERGMMKLVKEKLPEVLKVLTDDLPQSGSVKVVGVADIAGDASITVARGKRKHLLDLTFNVEFEMKVGDDAGNGKFCYTEVTANDDDDWEVTCEVGNDTAPALKGIIDTFVKPSGSGLQGKVNEALKKFIAEFKAL